MGTARIEKPQSSVPEKHKGTVSHTLQPLIQGGINSALHHRQELRVHKETSLRVLLPLLVATGTEKL